LGIARLVYHLGIALISIILSAASPANAQSLPGSSVPPGNPAAEDSGASASGGAGSSDNEVEALYDKEDSKPKPKAAKKVEEAGAQKKIPEAQSLSDLAKLAPFSDVAVIQRRFLPKSKRFEATVGAFTNLNNPFFSSYGLEIKAAYYLTEKWGIEGIGDYATTSSRQVTDDLAKLGITTSNLVTSRSFLGGALKWNPIYGKITLLNKSIVPFDINFDVGGGMTGTTDGQSAPTLHLGTSQVFAYSKSTAFRWDFSWNYFQANATDDNGKKSKISQSDIYLGIGISFYFPEASYR
jgi:outer membrane beta-barrel protein